MRATWKKAKRPRRRCGGSATPIADVVGRQSFVGWQSVFDPLLTPGARNYWKSHDFDALSDGAIDTMLARVGDLPTPECEIFIAHLGGAMARVSPQATPYPVATPISP